MTGKLLIKEPQTSSNPDVKKVKIQENSEKIIRYLRAACASWDVSVVMRRGNAIHNLTNLGFELLIFLFRSSSGIIMFV